MWKALAYFFSALSLASSITHCNTLRKLGEANLELATEREASARAAQEAEAAYRAAEQAHAKAVATITEKAHHERKKLAVDIARLTSSLRNRPERPAGAMPESSASAMACTGAQLYRSDGEFLVGEAARADKLRLELSECRALYDAAVDLTGKN